MECSHPTPLRPEAETTARTLLDMLAAVELVARGQARRVVMACLPGPALAAAEAQAHAQAAGVSFSVAERPGGGGVTVVIGPVQR